MMSPYAREKLTALHLLLFCLYWLDQHGLRNILSFPYIHPDSTMNIDGWPR
jgi:hypothetical protein